MWPEKNQETSVSFDELELTRFRGQSVRCLGPEYDGMVACRIVHALGAKAMPPAALHRLLRKSRELSRGLDDAQEASRTITEVISAAVIHPSELELRLRCESLAGLLDVEISAQEQTYRIKVPCRLARRGQEMKFVLPAPGDHDTGGNADPELIQAVAKAHLWWRWIEEGEVRSLAEIATKEKLDKAQMMRRLRLAFLSPSLVERILTGAQPAELTLEVLLRKIDLPLGWAAQERLLS